MRPNEQDLPGGQANLPVAILMFSGLGALLAVLALLFGFSFGAAAIAYLLPVGSGLGFALRAHARGRNERQVGTRIPVNQERFRK